MKVQRQGKMHSSVSSSPATSSCSSYKDPHTVLKLLPLTILALALALPAQDQEVIAYMITKSIFTTTTNRSPDKNKTKCKRKYNQKSPLFECGCFDCYTRFWYRWDSSPNRNLIHQVIEAFEDHLLQNESPKKHNRCKSKKDKVVYYHSESNTSFKSPKKELEKTESGNGEEICDGCKQDVVEENVGEVINGNLDMQVVTVQVLQAPVSSHKGLARKVLPDVVGLLNSRLWSLWSTSI